MARDRFNGATTKVSWKSVQTVADLHGSRTLQWGHDEGSWKTATEQPGAVTADIASMGPRRRSWKTTVSLTTADRDRRRFNGATTKVSWKTATAGSTSAPMTVELQWGHDEGVVEDCDRRNVTRAQSIALQWGHDEGVVEDAPLGATCRIAVSALFRERVPRTGRAMWVRHFGRLTEVLRP